MSLILANLLPPMTKSWADEANDEFEEQSIDDLATIHFVDTSKFDRDTVMGEAYDFRDYEVRMIHKLFECAFNV